MAAGRVNTAMTYRTRQPSLVTLRREGAGEEEQGEKEGEERKGECSNTVVAPWLEQPG